MRTEQVVVVEEDNKISGCEREGVVGGAGDAAVGGAALKTDAGLTAGE